MKLGGLAGYVAAAAVAAALAIFSTASGASARDDTSVEGCVLQRAPAAALVKASDDSLVELDLHLVLGTPFNVKPDSCFRFYGASQGQGQNRVYPQAGWQFQATSVDDAVSHINDKSKETKQDDERPEEKIP